MRLVADTGVFSAAISRRRRASIEREVQLLEGHQIFLASQTVAELRYGSLVAQWGTPRREQLEAAIAAVTVVPVTDELITHVARLRADCKAAGHPLADPVHNADLWIAATALHIAARLVTTDSVFLGTPGLDLA